MNIDKQRKQECLKAKCGLDKSRCIVKYGKNCIKNGGRKIPVRGVNYNQKMRIEAQASNIKPYFIKDGWVMDVERD